ncbi:unnamed protein product (macronuclear) [Paramecium tetraurelia]|uniref:Transmembrane protein n=1 Tax=Paramecium tetraurelia TaxID=5888 RepID=A0CD28_PARTE|nr:uncharacterized protein GSPATT00037480001 [Paramecium tetraurelia]CAK68695.1 unnamed protein product [Paramecium tetraurelia]|eukprot:XP_001436092.1 hypothetical protein (macronuclear) [Paramecium tetraurelia strain d4-2]
MSEEIDQHLEMQETNIMLLQQFDNETQSQEAMSPYQFSEHSDLPSPKKQSRKKEKILEKLISNRAKFNERAALFNLINSLQLAITLYNLSSIINIEGQSNLKFYDSSSIFSFYRWNKQGFTVYYLITILVMVHVLKLLTCLVGYFCVVQKSEQLLTIFMMLTFTCVITRGIITILLLIDYGQILQTQSYVYGKEDKVAQSQTIQFTVVLVIFVAVEIVMGLQSLLYAGQAKEKYKQMRVNEKRIAQHYQIAYQITLRQFLA